MAKASRPEEEEDSEGESGDEEDKEEADGAKKKLWCARMNHQERLPGYTSSSS
jgi:hypothetical protein